MAEDVMDVAVDAPACATGEPTPAEYITASGFNNNVSVTSNDATAIGGGNNLVIPGAVIRMPDMGMLSTMGDCTQIPMVNVARFGSPDVDLGTLAITENTQMGSFVYDNTMSAYASTGFDTWVLTPGHTITLGVPSLDAGVFSQVVPPTLMASQITASFTDSANPIVSRTDATAVSFTPIAEDGLIFNVLIAPQANPADHPLWCGVRACRGSLTIPAEFVSAWPAGTALQIQVTSSRVVQVPASTPFGFVVGSSVLYAAVAQ